MEHIWNSAAVVIPIVFVLAYGYGAGRFKAFGSPDAIETINKLVLTFALPPLLFVGTVSVSRAQLEQELVLFAVLLISLLIAFVLGLLLARYLFKRNLIEASIAGLAFSFAAGPFYGPALLGGLYGPQSGVAVSMISLVINVVVVPIAVTIIKVELAKAQSEQQSLATVIGQAIYRAIFKTPFVWAPLVGFVLVFLEVPVPEVARKSLVLIGQATAGVAVFVAGMTIAANRFRLSGEVLLFVLLKNVALPAMVLGVALPMGMHIDTDMLQEGLLLAALPAGPMIVLLATRYQQYQEEASSILALSTVGMLISVTALVIVLRA